MAAIETVEVYLDADQIAEPNLMGTLHCQRSGKGELFSFKYAKAWLDQAEAFAFDPDLTLGEGHQYPSADRSNFGIFLEPVPLLVNSGIYSTNALFQGSNLKSSY
jgi:serine/threonine-protein kinase HipA